MNPLNINYIKIDKANSIKLRYQKLRKITNFFRVFEIFLFLAVISRLSFHLPLGLALKLLDEHIHYLTLILVSPKFVFIVGNAIVIVLFVNAGQVNSQPNAKKPKTHPNEHKKVKLELKKQRKTEENAIIASIFASSEHHVVKIYQRSKSEKLRSLKMERSFYELRRSKTEIKSFKCYECCKYAGEGHYPEDHMSSEEFRKTIEDFIAKQQRYLREEEESF